ncbi:zinc finger protein 469 isoform X1 [Arapaima gigas]
MTGEIQNVYATKESDTGSEEQGKSVLLPQFSEKRRKESPEPYKSEGLALLASTGTKFVAKEKEYSQREAIIRPQQTGKIDFKSLQNRPKFSSDDSTWPSSKGCPQSPTGKKTRDKGKKSGKSERSNPHQSYRLSITNSRSNPTIGIAYPQQKITPPKKLEAIRGPISGSYRSYQLSGFTCGFVPKCLPFIVLVAKCYVNQYLLFPFSNFEQPSHQL